MMEITNLPTEGKQTVQTEEGEAELAWGENWFSVHQRHGEHSGYIIESEFGTDRAVVEAALRRYGVFPGPRP